VRVQEDYPNVPAFYLGSVRRYGMRAFLSANDVNRILTAEDYELLEAAGTCYLPIRIYSVRVVGRSVSRKSLNVEVADWSNVRG